MSDGTDKTHRERDEAGQLVRKEIDLLLVARLANAHATVEQIAAACNVNRSTITRRMHDDPEFRALVEDGRENATQYMRSQMLKLAYDDGIPANVRAKMLIWLSQKYLGMGQRIEAETTHHGAPVIVRIPMNGREPQPVIDGHVHQLEPGDDG